MHLRDCQVDCGEAAYVGDTIGDMRMAARARVDAWAAGWSEIAGQDLIDNVCILKMRLALTGEHEVMVEWST